MEQVLDFSCAGCENLFYGRIIGIFDLYGLFDFDVLYLFVIS